MMTEAAAAMHLAGLGALLGVGILLLFAMWAISTTRRQ
jgi:hypothetical protein